MDEKRVGILCWTKKKAVHVVANEENLWQELTWATGWTWFPYRFIHNNDHLSGFITAYILF